MGVVAIVGFKEDVPTDPDSEMMQQIIAIGKQMSAVYGFKEKGN